MLDNQTTALVITTLLALYPFGVLVGGLVFDSRGKAVARASRNRPAPVADDEVRDREAA
jgi:hypothetical protein